MKAYTGSSSDGFSSTLMPATGAAATALAPEPQDSTATFTDVLEQEQGGSTPSWPGAPAAPAADATALGQLTSFGSVLHSDPALATPVATPPAATATLTFVAPLVSADVANTSASSSAAAPAASGSTEPSTDASLSANVPVVSDDPAPPLRIPAYVWMSRLQPSATTQAGSSSSPDLSSTNGTTASDSGFTAPRANSSTLGSKPSSAASASAASASTSPEKRELLTLAQYLLAAPQPKPAAPAPVATTTPTPVTDLESDDAGTPQDATVVPAPLSTSFGVTGKSADATRTLPSPIHSVATPASTDDSSDSTSAAIIAAVFKSNPAPGVVPNTTLPTPEPAVASAAQPKLPPPQPQVIAPEPAPAPAVSTKPYSTATPFATSMAHVAVLAATRTQSPAAPASTPADTASTAATLALSEDAATPLTVAHWNWASKSSIQPSGVEKKSATTTAERSSVPPKAESSATLDTTASLLQAALAASGNVPVNQAVATTSPAPARAVNSLATAPLTSAGTTNDKSSSDMASTLGMQNLVSSGTHPLVTRADADLHIQLGTNADFHHALDQVMHVADLSNLSRVTPPLRVAIEIQTPPGAIVNLYISRQPDSSYRAQLSTNDAQALGWVQQQVGSLKDTSDAGTAIRWSPAQLESGTTATAGAGSSGSDRDFDWNRGGQQGQAGYDQDERNARRQAAHAESDDAESLGFFESISAVGGAA